MGTIESGRARARQLAIVLLLGVAAQGCIEGATQPIETTQPPAISHPPGTYAKPGRDYPRLIVWADGRFDCIVDGNFICPWNGSCCDNDQKYYSFYAVFSGTGATTRDALSATLRGIYFRSPPDTIAVTGSSFRADWNGFGWNLDCAITATCGEPQTASWVYSLLLVP